VIFDGELKFFFLYLLISMCISFILPLLSFLLTNRVVTKEKLSAYECGFEPFGHSRLQFTVHFYLVAILFLIFDLEVILLFPWCFVISTMESQFFYLMLYFFLILGVGYIYEWRRGALEW
jgi:NADH:ubiquinone oxidoreductase subunit 3 (subunit A)